MVVLQTKSEFGHAPPPQTPYSIISNLPGWDMLRNFRDGDMSPMAKVVHIYPRFTPTHYVRELCTAVAQKLGMEGKGCQLFLNPIMWDFTARHVVHSNRQQFAISADQLTFKVVDISGHRLYAILFEPQHGMALMESWGTPGIGLSIREAEHLIKKIDSLVEVPCPDTKNPPKPTWTPEGPSHELLQRRISYLLHRAPVHTDTVKCGPADVFLFPSGMAAIFYVKNFLEQYRPGKNVELGVLFHNSHEMLEEQSSKGCVHFGNVDKEGLDKFESWLEKEAEAKRDVSFVLVEFSCNPSLDSVDLPRLKKLSEKYGFVLVADDTLSGFGNVDILAQCDILLTSLTKSFNGRSDVLGGSIVLNPLSPQYADLAGRFPAQHHNELFAADADVLLANSEDFLSRTATLNENARTMAEYLHSTIGQPGSPVVKVQYPSLLPSKADYDAFKRQSTPELPEPGYGCLLNVVFDSDDTARAFYDSCGFYPSPHLGGHVTIMFPYNMFMFGKTAERRDEYNKYGTKGESIRISAGLEDKQDLLDTLKFAYDKAVEVKKGAQTNGEAVVNGNHA